jgi:PPK2 family polyphosphate:nucleotide phosphotransferase
MDYRDKFIVKPGQRLRLNEIDPSYKGHQTADAAIAETERYRLTLTRLQSLLYAEKRHSLLIVLQALDAGGKDGTINHVFAAFNPQGVRVVGFKKPTDAELAHDFLWRVHPYAPARGEIVIFNRSHYEDVLITRVHQLIEKAVWTARYDRIREFEKGLAESGTTVLKFFLHISKDEQLSRFAQRLEDPAHNWKISASDYDERALWNDYITAFDDALSDTSTDHAPWFVIPANHKWFRNLAVSQIVADTIDQLRLSYPPPTVDLTEIRRKYHIAEQAAEKARGLSATAPSNQARGRSRTP